MRCRMSPHNMSLNFSIDRILSPDFGPCKHRAFDSTTNTCSVSGTPQGLCKSEDFGYKKLLPDTCKDLEMPSANEMRANAVLMSLISGFDFYGTGNDVFKNQQTTDILMFPRKFVDKYDLESLNRLSTSPDDYSSVKSSCSGKESGPLANVANLIEGIFSQKAHGLTCGKSFQPSVDYSEQSNSPIPFPPPNLAGEPEQSKPPPANKVASASFTKDTSPRKSEESKRFRDSKQPLTKPHPEEDLHQTDEAEISCDTKPQVPEKLFQTDDRCLSTDGRCSSSSVDTLSSTAGSESNPSPASCEKLKPDQIRTVIKEPLSDDCVDSPPSTFKNQSSTQNQKPLSDDLGGIIPPPGKDWPVWIFCNRYSARPSSGPRSRRQSRKLPSSEEKRCRTAFTMLQLNKLHREFESSPYLDESRRHALARDLQLSESQVKIWFQNRRAKVKKATGTNTRLADLLKEQGLYNHSTSKA